MRNIEVKVRCPDLEAARLRAQALGASDEGFIPQCDTFFEAPAGRLKLRVFQDGSGELIGYRRADGADARPSDYLIHKTSNPETLKEVLAYALGERGTVRKRRRLYLYRHTRIHLDEVEGLGTFVELETVIRDQPQHDAQAELEDVRLALGLDACEVVPVAYLDLLAGVSQS
jgi:predicted adenylyl cyclase CyaB